MAAMILEDVGDVDDRDVEFLRVGAKRILGLSGGTGDHNTEQGHRGGGDWHKSFHFSTPCC
jgi:hypothetical protein